MVSPLSLLYLLICYLSTVHVVPCLLPFCLLYSIPPSLNLSLLLVVAVDVAVGAIYDCTQACQGMELNPTSDIRHPTPYTLHPTLYTHDP